MRLSTTGCWVKLKAINGKKKERERERERKEMVTGFDFAGKQINQEQDTEAERAVLVSHLFCVMTLGRSLKMFSELQ